MNTDSAGIRVEMRGGVFSEVEAETEESEGLAGGGANDGLVFTIGSVKTRAWGKAPSEAIHLTHSGAKAIDEASSAGLASSPPRRDEKSSVAVCRR